MENKFSNVLVGVFVVGFLLLFMTISVWLTSSHEKIESIQYQIITDENVSGVSIKSSVDYQGVEVGKVKSIVLDKKDPKNVIITLDIFEGTPIKKDTTAVLVGKGITGLVGVSLAGGSTYSDPLLPTKIDPIPTIQAGPSLTKRIDTAIDSVTLALADLSVHLNDILTPDNVDKFSKILANVERFTDDLSKTTPDIQLLVNNATSMVEDIKPKVEAAANSLQSLKPIMATLSNSSKDLDKFIKSLTEVPINFNKTFNQWRVLADSTNSEVQAMMPEIYTLLNNIAALVEQLNDKPNSIIMGKRKQRKGPGE